MKSSDVLKIIDQADDLPTLSTVATKVGNVEDILLDDGIVVPPKSPENMADGVIKFAHNSKYRLECIKRGRDRAILDYDLDRLIHRYAEIYEQYNVQEKAKWLA